MAHLEVGYPYDYRMVDYVRRNTDNVTLLKLDNEQMENNNAVEPEQCQEGYDFSDPKENLRFGNNKKHRSKAVRKSEKKAAKVSRRRNRN